ncbi:MAG: hypothetical protein Q8R83_05005 [Legionellaceae bacterium]|nr:hypothetical protein [Legionellaceae bacterium]
MRPLKSKTITLQDAKNREIHTLPMSDFIYDLLEGGSRQKISEFIFPADSKTGYIYDTKKAVLKVTLYFMHIYLDESGDLGFEFGDKNPSSHFIITLLVCDNHESAKVIKKSCGKKHQKK